MVIPNVIITGSWAYRNSVLSCNSSVHLKLFKERERQQQQTHLVRMRGRHTATLCFFCRNLSRRYVYLHVNISALKRSSRSRLRRQSARSTPSPSPGDPSQSSSTLKRNTVEPQYKVTQANAVRGGRRHGIPLKRKTRRATVPTTGTRTHSRVCVKHREISEREVTCLL